MLGCQINKEAVLLVMFVPFRSFLEIFGNFSRVFDGLLVDFGDVPCLGSKS